MPLRLLLIEGLEVTLRDNPKIYISYNWLVCNGNANCKLLKYLMTDISWFVNLRKFTIIRENNGHLPDDFDKIYPKVILSTHLLQPC